MASLDNDSERKYGAVGPTELMPIKHPELERLGRKSIQRFLHEREQYMRIADDAVAQGSSYTTVSLVNSVSFTLLEALIAFNTFGKVARVSELTDDALLNWLKSLLEKKCRHISRNSLELLVLKTIRFDTEEPDPVISVVNVFMDYYALLKRLNMPNLTTENPKIAVNHICRVLELSWLKQKIKEDLAGDKAALRKD